MFCKCIEIINASWKNYIFSFFYHLQRVDYPEIYIVFEKIRKVSSVTANFKMQLFTIFSRTTIYFQYYSETLCEKRIPPPDNPEDKSVCIYHVSEYDAGVRGEMVHQRVVVRRKEDAAAARSQFCTDTGGDRRAVVRRCAAALVRKRAKITTLFALIQRS